MAVADNTPVPVDIRELTSPALIEFALQQDTLTPLELELMNRLEVAYTLLLDAQYERYGEPVSPELAGVSMHEYW